MIWCPLAEKKKPATMSNVLAIAATIVNAGFGVQRENRTMAT